MPPCAEPDCELPAIWSEGFQEVLCNEHFLERFDADVETTSALLPTATPRKAAEVAPTWTAKWLRFEEQPQPNSRKTRRWEIYAKQGDVFLGVVTWSSWRKYEFLPGYGTAYEEQCLRDIARFLEEQTRAHKFAAGRR